MVLKLREIVVVLAKVWGRRLATELKTDRYGEFRVGQYGAYDEMSAAWI